MKNISPRRYQATDSECSTIVGSFDALDINSGSSADDSGMSGTSPRMRMASDESTQPITRSIHARKSLKLLRSFQSNGPSIVTPGDNPIRQPVTLNPSAAIADLEQKQRSRPFIKRAFSRNSDHNDAWSSPNLPSRGGACIPTLFKRRVRSGAMTVKLADDITVTDF